ncbi:MAG TPA: GatB/YqeY domain-containing protein [Candidatus Saccharimonadales bacterium]|nr:GatB/YqeY domain-containing protein [Candidatus Saccharimonadales bacterium]
MSLQQTIEQDLIVAMKANDAVTRDTLRLLKSSLQNAAIELHKDELTDEDVQPIIVREVKRRHESIEAFNQVGKADLAKDEEAEIKVLEKYLPTQMSEEEIITFVANFLKDKGFSASDTGRAMGKISRKLKGKADMGLVSKIVRETLSK